MTWKSLPETRAVLSTLDEDRVRRLFSLRVFLESAVLPEDYETNPEWSQAVVLSDDARAFLGAHSELREKFAEPVLALAFFVDFFHHDLWLDVGACDVEGIEAMIDRELRSGSFRLPYRYGRLLYDRYNDNPPGDKTEHLEPNETAFLLEGTPQGIYQAGRYVTGPLGVIASRELRLVPPSTYLPLWHCSDTGCRALHNVGLRPPSVPPVRALQSLRSICEAELGPASDWRFEQLCRPPVVNDIRQFYDLPATVAEALTEDERRYLLFSLLGSDQGPAIRSIIAEKAGRDQSRGSPAEVGARLEDASRLQLLLSLSNTELVRLTDHAIVSAGIRVPLYERRSANIRPPRTPEDLSTDISVFGVRSRHRDPLLHTMAVIWRAYESTGHLEELGWRLRKRAGEPPRSALSEFLHRVSPAEAIRQLVLSSMPIAVAVGDRLGIEIQAETESTSVVDRLLWKLGFNPPRYENDYQQLRERIQQFNETLLRVGSVRSEKDREIIRSSGVNLFVSVEAFLERLVAYNVWVLSSDHFLETSFTYSLRDALTQVLSVIGANVISGGVDFRWNSAGGNALGSALVYANAASEWMATLANTDAQSVARPEADLPHFSETQERIFRFRHVQLWGDSDPDALRSYSSMFANVVRHLNQAEIATVRNGLDHQRYADDFPSIEAMLACSARLREAVDLADIHRFIPKTFWLQVEKRDLFGRVEYILEDYQSRQMSVSGPSVAVPLTALRFSEPYLIAPGGLLSDVGAELRFRIKESSAYSHYWSNYPRRRHIPSPHKEAAQEDDDG
jgi:hypothetical protein